MWEANGADRLKSLRSSGGGSVPGRGLWRRCARRYGAVVWESEGAERQRCLRISGVGESAWKAEVAMVNGKVRCRVVGGGPIGNYVSEGVATGRVRGFGTSGKHVCKVAGPWCWRRRGPSGNYVSEVLSEGKITERLRW